MSQNVQITKQDGWSKVTWAGAQASNWIDVRGRNSSLRLELPAAFTGTTLTYHTKSGAGDETAVPIHKDGSAVSDTVAGSALSCNVLSVDLYGVDWLRITSDQSETCVGYLHGSS